MKEFFEIVKVSREDILNVFEDVTDEQLQKITDEQMEDIARYMEEYFCSMGAYWDALDEACQKVLAPMVCPHCNVMLEERLHDIDGTNIVSKETCPLCGYGTPSLN